MSFKKNKEQSLKQLRDFCSRIKVYGWCSNMWYHGLKNAYPLEFIYYTQFSTKPSIGREYAKNRYLDNVNLKFQKLLEYPLEEDDVEYLNSISNQLDNRISQKEKQLKN